ncbi:MAG: M4 family metallopeptidase, partial [Bacteroidales bacterium]|nr:M4 family metallopeptidase [Bacteroidales bacterium]
MRFGKGDHKLLYQIDTIFTKDYVGLDEKMHLSYKVTVVDENDISVDLNLFLDVETGQILKVEKNIFESVVGSAETRYSGRVSINTLQIDSLYVLKDTTRGNGIYIKNLHNGDDITYCTEFYDNDNNWTAQEYHNTNKDDGALDAFWALQQTYDYFYNNFNRNSFNDNGRAIYGYVHYGTNIENAYWDNTLQCLLLGDGRSRFDILTSLDVIAHEFGHAICLYTANLRYYGESGALNEGLSDIWAACVENDVTANKQKWIIGEDIEKRTGHLGLRSMSNPKTEEQPDTYGGTYWVDNLSSDCAYDNCGVHTNSGVLNHWFYLLCQGGSGINDLGNPYNVIGIDFGQAAAIVYRAECLYLTSNSNYSDMRTCTIQAALDLFPESFIFVSVISAWYAVGVEDCTLYSYTNQTLSDVKHINACS